MSLIKSQKLNLKGRIYLRGLLAEGQAPYILSILFPDGSVTRNVFKTEDEIRDFLDELGRRGVIIPLTSKKLLIMRAYLEEKEDYIDLILERVIPSVSVVIFGAGHVGRAVAQISTQMGWDIIIIDDRIEFLEQVDESSGKVKKIGQYFEDAFRDMRLNYTSALVIVTRGHQFDQICLEASLKTDAFYIGMIGSRRRVGSIFKELERKGVSRQRLSEVHAPIGLDIGAKTPQEIAVSIVAEIIRFKNLSVDREIEEST